MANNQIPLFKKIEDSLLKKSGFKVNNIDLSYDYYDEIRIIDLSKLEENILNVNEFDPEWNPVNNNLKVKIEMSFENIGTFFGVGSVTGKHNKLGMAAKVYSRGSNYQKIYPTSLLNNDDESKKIIQEFVFPPAFFRDSLSIEFFIYLADIKNISIGQAQKIGTILSEDSLYILTIHVDGDGSLFPITEFRDPNGPFWQLEKSWVSSEEDTFDSSNVRLALNIEHKLFDQINRGRQKASQKVMNDIIIQAITMIIQDVIIVEQAQLSEADESVENSILRIVKYWVETFDVDTSSLFSITNSLNQNIERTIRGEHS